MCSSFYHHTDSATHTHTHEYTHTARIEMLVHFVVIQEGDGSSIRTLPSHFTMLATYHTHTHTPHHEKGFSKQNINTTQSAQNTKPARHVPLRKMFRQPSDTETACKRFTPYSSQLMERETHTFLDTQPATYLALSAST